MYEKVASIIVGLSFIALLQGCSDSSDSDPKNYFNPVIAQAEAAGLEINEKQLAEFSNHDATELATVNHYPLIRLDLGTIQVWETYEIYRDIMDAYITYTLTTGWDYSTWDELKVVQSSPTKVHIAGRFSRYDKDGNRLGTSETFRFVTKEGDKWGIKMRSSWAQSTFDVDNENSISEKDVTEAEVAAKKIVEQYMEKFNNRNCEGLADLNIYPYVLFLDVDLKILNTREEFVVYEECTVLPELDYAEWDHSELYSLDVVQSGAEKAHLAIKYAHFDVLGKTIGVEEGILVVVKNNDRWSFQARSML